MGGIPDSYLNGGSVQNSYVNNASNLSSEAALPAFAAINLSATYGGNLLTVTAEVTPYADFPGSHKLHIVAVESYTYTGGTTSQTQFKYAQRKMLPNGSGITMANLQAGIAQSFTQSYSFTSGGVAQGNYNLWGQLANVKVVAFVQNTSTKEVLQAAFVSQLAVGMEENALSRHLTLYPNPTEGQLNLGFDLPASTNVRFQVVNMLGEQVMSSSRSFGSGAQQHVLDLGGLSAGSYFVQVVADGMTATRKVTLSR